MNAFCIACGAKANDLPLDGFYYCAAHRKRQRYLRRRAAKRLAAEHIKNVLFEATMRHILKPGAEP